MSTTQLDAVLANEAELYFERGGPTYRLVARCAQRLGLKVTVHRRIIGFLAITWLPLFILAALEGRALGAASKESFLFDFATYVRFFLGVPLLIVAEQVVGPRLTSAGLQFVKAGLVGAEDFPSFDRAIASAGKWRESFWAECAILVLALFGAWTVSTERLAGGGAPTWQSGGTGGRGVSWAGLYYHIVAVPIFQFFWYRWLWRFFVWVRFLWTVSRFRLHLVATHSDQAGGLGFLGDAHASFGILTFTLSALLSADVAFLLIFEEGTIDPFKVPFAGLLVFIDLLFLGPLLTFTPLLNRVRLQAVLDYGTLVAHYNRAFHKKWIDGERPEDELLLGSADIQSMADMGNTFEFVRRMKPIPFSLRVIIQLAIVTSLPFAPLALIVMPLDQIVDLITKAIR
jgi:hypothetical protein